MRLYRGAQRLLALEEQVVARGQPSAGDDELAGTFEIGASTGPGRDRARAAALRVPGDPSRAPRRRSGSSTPRRSSSASPRASSSSASSAPRAATAASSSSRSCATRSILACPPGHPFAGRTIDARRAARRRPDRDAGGRGRAPADRGRAAARRRAAARPRRAARARAAGVGHERRARRLRRHVHLAHARSRPISPPARSPRRASRGSRWSGRSSSCARSGAPRRARRARSSTSVAAGFGLIVRWSLAELAGAARRRSASRGRCWSASPRVAGVARGRRSQALDARCPRERIEVPAGADGAARDRRRLGDRHREGRLGGDRPAARLGADDLLGRRVDAVVRDPHARPAASSAAAAARSSRAIVYEVALTLDLPRPMTVGHAR